MGTTNGTTTTKPASRLIGIKSGKLREPLRLLTYGVEGVGKSSMAAASPDPIWLDVEGGSGHLEVTRYPFRDGVAGHVPTEYAEVLRAIDDLGTGEHGFKTVVIDTVDRLEALIWQHVCRRESKPGKEVTSIEAFGYGKGYVMAIDEWRNLCLRLDRLRAAKGMNVILLGHCQIRTFKSPDTDDWDRYSLRLHDKAAGFLKEWADVTGFACFEEGASALGENRPKGYSTGKRFLKLERTAAYDAKSRIPLPPQVELDPANPWAPFAAALEQGESMPAPAIADLIAAEAARIGDPVTTAKVEKAVKEAIEKNDTAILGRYLQKLKQMQPAAQAA